MGLKEWVFICVLVPDRERPRKTVEVYRPGREPEVLEGGSVVEGEGPVAGFVLALARIWG